MQGNILIKNSQKDYLRRIKSSFHSLYYFIFFFNKFIDLFGLLFFFSI